MDTKENHKLLTKLFDIPPVILKQSELEEFKATLHNFIGRLHEHWECQEEGSHPYQWTDNALASATDLMESLCPKSKKN